MFGASVVVELRAVVVAGARQELEEGVEAAVERAAQLRNGAVDRVQGQPGFFAVGQLQPGVTGVLQRSFGHQSDAVDESVASHRLTILARLRYGRRACSSASLVQCLIARPPGGRRAW